MIERISEMPPGTLGFKAAGEITADELHGAALEPIREIVDDGGKLRVLTVVDHLNEDPRAVWESLKADLEFGFVKRDHWERTAVVTDVGWAKRLSKMFSWAAPGEFKVFDEDDLEDAKTWLARDEEAD